MRETKKDDCTWKHMPSMSYLSPLENWCLLFFAHSAEPPLWAQGLYIHSRHALPTLLNRPILSLNKSKIAALHVDSPVPPSSLLISHPPATLLPFFSWSSHRYTLTRDYNCKGTGANLNITLNRHLLFETRKSFIAKLGTLPLSVTFWHRLLCG